MNYSRDSSDDFDESFVAEMFTKTDEGESGSVDMEGDDCEGGKCRGQSSVHDVRFPRLESHTMQGIALNVPAACVRICCDLI